jgi:FkbM family methyltransferase
MTSKPDRKAILAHLTDITSGLGPNMAEVRRLVSSLSLHVPPSHLVAFADVVDKIVQSDRAASLAELLEPLIDGDRLQLWLGPLRFQDRSALCTIVEEILIRREYHFQSASDAPTVIDAGANVGLASYYARRMCNAGRLICFEPNPETFAILEENIAAMRIPSVELHCAALSREDGEAEFVRSASAPLAGSLAPRNTPSDSTRIKVPTRDLKPFLSSPIGLLKIDIEGAEAEVLEECADHLALVENLFCEVHPIPGETPSLLLRVLAVLERAGFYVHVARSPWSEKVHNTMPLVQAYRSYSLSVFATRVCPAPKG